MRVSDIILNHITKTIQTKTDALRLILTETDRDKYIRDFGDVRVIAKSEDTFHVPEFADQIDAYDKMKAADCRQYGCN